VVVVRFASQRWRAPAAALAAALVLLASGPSIVERNRAHWLDEWADLKPALAAVRGDSLALLVHADFGYFAGHILAAGNPVHPEVRTLTLEDLDALPPQERPRYLAAMPAPGTAQAANWRTLHAAEFARWGYTIAADTGLAAILERTFPPIAAPSGARLDAWYAPPRTTAIAGMAVLGHALRNGDIVAGPAGDLVRLDPHGRQPLQLAPGLVMRLQNCGDLDFSHGPSQGRPAGAQYRWDGDRWRLSLAQTVAGAPLPTPLWNVSISEGRYRQEVLSEDSVPFVRLRAENDARWLIYTAAYPEGLPDGVPVTVRAVVRCPNGCSLSTAGHAPDLDQPVRAAGWTPVSLSFAYRRNGQPQHYAVGLARCRTGDWFDLRSFTLRTGLFPYDSAQ
jgi:hypothetical protein